MSIIKKKVSLHLNCENSSVGRARPCQGRGRGFESRFSLSQSAKRVCFAFFLEIEILLNAQMVELVDTHVSGTCGLGCGGSSPPLGTTQ